MGWGGPDGGWVGTDASENPVVGWVGWGGPDGGWVGTAGSGCPGGRVWVGWLGGLGWHRGFGVFGGRAGWVGVSPGGGWLAPANSANDGKLEWVSMRLSTTSSVVHRPQSLELFCRWALVDLYIGGS
ncbi:hypothetical protein GCM10010483_53670 [Actinokineospora diospyrosa]